jgi:hypothetical protein
MKQTLLAIALLTALTVNASERENQASAYLSATQTSSVTSSVTSNGATNNGNSVNVDNDTRMPASSAIAPSVGTGNDCQIATPSSKAVSILLISVSGSTGTTINALCLAYKQGDKELTHQIACNTVPEYKKAQLQLGRTCKE